LRRPPRSGRDRRQLDVPVVVAFKQPDRVLVGLRAPHLKALTEPDEGRLVGDPRKFHQVARQHEAAIGVVGNRACPGKKPAFGRSPFGRADGQRIDPFLDLFHVGLTESVDGSVVAVGRKIQDVRALLLKRRTKSRGHADPALAVNLVGVGRREPALQGSPLSSAGGLLTPRP